MGNFTSYFPNKVLTNELFQKKTNRGLEDMLDFMFFTLPLEIPDKTKLLPQKLHKIVLHHGEIQRPKTKITGNCRQFFLDHPWKFHVVIN